MDRKKEVLGGGLGTDAALGLTLQACDDHGPSGARPAGQLGKLSRNREKAGQIVPVLLVIGLVLISAQGRHKHPHVPTTCQSARRCVFVEL